MIPLKIIVSRLTIILSESGKKNNDIFPVHVQKYAKLFNKIIPEKISITQKRDGTAAIQRVQPSFFSIHF